MPLMSSLLYSLIVGRSASRNISLKSRNPMVLDIQIPLASHHSNFLVNNCGTINKTTVTLQIYYFFIKLLTFHHLVCFSTCK